MRKITFLFLTTCLILTHLTVGYTQETDLETLRASDVNADGVINILDLTLVAASIGTTPAADQPLNPDVNGDGTVNILDLTRVASHVGKTVPPPVAFVSANPAIGRQIPANATITVTFDNSPDNVTVNAGVATTVDKTVTITGPFAPGAFDLAITWTGGSQTLTYTVDIPDIVAPEVISGTLSDGLKDVDPEMVNNSRRIEIEFSEEVTGNIALQTASGNDVGWIGKVEGRKGTLELVQGKELGNEMTYVIVGKVSDAVGNATDISITFTLRSPAVFVSANPVDQSRIEVNDTITLTFDNPPEDVTVSTGVATLTGKTVEITGPFDPGALALTVTWADGTQTLNYTIRTPAAFVSANPAAQSQIDVDDSITLTFDNPPEDLTVSTGVATLTGKIVAITGPFDPGALALTVTWADGTQTLNYTIRPPAAFVSANPAARSHIDVDDTITLTFDNPPEDVTVNAGTARIIGKRVRLTGPFDPGALRLTVTWADGSQTLRYTVRVPDTEAPKIISGSVNNGDKDVDPEALHFGGPIEIEFSEAVTGNIALQTVAGADVGWRGKVTGKKGTLEFVRGKELGNEITYVIAGKVSDAAGNSTDINIRFTTSPKTSGIPFAVTDATFNSLVLNSEIPIVVEFVKDG